jgi:alpha-beta hydrolase superfamily lysophospholipase
MNEPVLSELLAQGGERIAVQDWPLDDEGRMRGQVLLMHGLGEHAGRYKHVAKRLNDWGFSVRGYDQYGHGKSSGRRGSMPNDQRLLDDLEYSMAATRKRMPENKPLILLGHSMGGVVSARIVSMGIKVQGLVLSSPALDPGLTIIERTLLRVLLAMAPDLCIANGLNPEKISHDPQTVQAYRQDPLVHDRISARLGRFIVREGAAVRLQAKDWRVATLLLYAGDDKLVNPLGSAAFAQAAPSNVVQAYCFSTMYHEIFNELGREAVFDKLKTWLDSKF